MAWGTITGATGEQADPLVRKARRGAAPDAMATSESSGLPDMRANPARRVNGVFGRDGAADALPSSAPRTARRRRGAR
jgi:hypothetical protein